jgi:hypothetical protein
MKMSDKLDMAMKATPPEDLYEYLMDSSIPKSEAEHFAADRITELEAKLDRVRGWAWELHDSLKLHQCGDGCNGCPVCRIPDEACDTPDELQSELGDEE